MEHRRCHCPVCGRNALCFDYKILRTTGEIGVLVHCHHCRSGQEAIAKATGIEPQRLLEWPPPDELGPWTEKRYGRRDDAGPPEAPPTIEQMQRYRATLWQLPEAMRYLREERRFTVATVRESGMGYGSYHNRPPAFILPIFDERGRLVSIKERFWPKLWVKRKRGSFERTKERKTRNLFNHPHYLYPIKALRKSPVGRGPDLIICEGEFDALLLNQALSNIPTVTSTTGKSWDEAWNRYIVGKRVAIIYDAGALAFSKVTARAEQFLAAGAKEAFAVDLRKMEFRDEEDITDWFMTYNYSAEELKRFIQTERR